MTMHILPSSIEINEAQVRSALAQAALHGRTNQAPSPRYQTDSWVATADALDAYSRHVDGLVVRELAERKIPVPTWLPELYADEHRADAFTGGAGGFPRDFEYIRTRLLEEKRQPLNAFRLFPRDGEVPLGARTHTARRLLGTGEAQIHRGGSEFPRARTQLAEEQFGVAYVVTAVQTNYFEMLTTDWAGIRQYQNDLRMGFRVVEERMNRIAWNGDSASNIDGVLNHRHLAKQVLSVAFDGTGDPEDVARALTDLASTPMVESGGTFGGNRMAVSPRIYRYISTTKHSSTGGTDTTILEWFLKGQDVTGIRSVDMAQELAGVGPNGEDGILVYRDEVDSVGHVLIQPPTTLPVYQASPIDQVTLIFGATGGVTMFDVGNNILGLAEV